MNAEKFEEIVGKRLELVNSIFLHKAKEYALGGDRLHNFKVASRISGDTVAKALWGMAMKHLVSVTDLVDGLLEPTEEMVNEKVGDMINYLILLEAVLKEGDTNG